MKKIFLLLAIVLAFQRLPAQMPDNNFFAPLFLYTNGPGRIYPAYDGEMLRVGRTYSLRAIPDPGYKFAGWQPVNIFIITQTNFDVQGEPILPPVQSIVPSFVPTTNYEAHLHFKMQDAMLISPDGENLSIATAFGWRANFVPWYEPLPRLPRQ